MVFNTLLAFLCVGHTLAGPIDSDTIQRWSAKFRGWHYYQDWAVPPQPSGTGLEGGQLTDVAQVFQIPGESGWRMFYTTFDGIGYRSAMARSYDLLNWDTSQGVVYSPRSGDAPSEWIAIDGEYDYGGAAFIGPLLADYNLTAPRMLKQANGRFWVAYYGQPTRNGYEVDPGGTGLASSTDGLVWERATSRPILSVDDPDTLEWEHDCIYAPFWMEHDGEHRLYYNAKGANAGTTTEQSGIATFPSSGSLPGLSNSGEASLWRRFNRNPVLPNNLSAGSYDYFQAADPKIFWDEDHWVMFYFGGIRDGHAVIMVAHSLDGWEWSKDPEPLYKAGGHPAGLDQQHAHKIWLVYHNGRGYLYYTAVGPEGRGIALLTSTPLDDDAAGFQMQGESEDNLVV